jgi:hypothetical protein
MARPPSAAERLANTHLALPRAPALDVLSGLGLRATAEAQRLGLFDCLAQRPREAFELSVETGVAPERLELLLSALESLALVRLRNGRYENTRIATRWLLQTTDGNMTAGLRFWSTVLSGDGAAGDEPPGYADWLADQARECAAEVIERARPVPGVKAIEATPTGGAFAAALRRRDRSATLVPLADADHAGSWGMVVAFQPLPRLDDQRRRLFLDTAWQLLAPGGPLVLRIMLIGAGFDAIRRHSLQTAPGMTLLLARRGVR